MFEYLVVSKTRRSLLKLLWLERASGTANDLSLEANVAYAGAYRELKQMAGAGLAKIEWDKGKKVFSANEKYPQSRLLRKLMSPTAKASTAIQLEAATLKSSLAALGLPVFSKQTLPRSSRKVDLESLVVEAVDLAESDASVARTLPVLLFRVRSELDYQALKRKSRLAENRHRVGFFLELTGMLGSDEELIRAAEGFFDRRRRGLRPFFSNQSKSSDELARERTPEVARKWGWSMNMGFDAFESTFRKFVDGPVPA